MYDGQEQLGSDKDKQGPQTLVTPKRVTGGVSHTLSRVMFGDESRHARARRVTNTHFRSPTVNDGYQRPYRSSSRERTECHQSMSHSLFLTDLEIPGLRAKIIGT